VEVSGKNYPQLAGKTEALSSFFVIFKASFSLKIYLVADITAW